MSFPDIHFNLCRAQFRLPSGACRPRTMSVPASVTRPVCSHQPRLAARSRCRGGLVPEPRSSLLRLARGPRLETMNLLVHSPRANRRADALEARRLASTLRPSTSSTSPAVVQHQLTNELPQPHEFVKHLACIPFVFASGFSKHAGAAMLPPTGHLKPNN